MEARLQIAATANADAFAVRLWDVGFPDPAAPTVASGTFLLSSLDAAAPGRQEILEKVRTQSNADAVFLEAGKKLYGLLRQATVAQPWRQLVAQGGRTYLELGAQVEDLPWELICDEPAGLPERFFARPHAPIVRVHADVGRALPMEPMLRVFIVIGQTAPTITAFPGDHVAAIRRKFASCEHNVHLELSESPTQARLAEQLEALRPHVFFFVGHGAQNPNTKRPALVFGPADDVRDWWDSDDIYNQFSNQDWSPRLVVLNACESSASNPSMVAVASAFARSGALAVVGNQATVRVDRALELSADLCKHLVAGTPIDVAVAQIRNALGRTSGWSRRDWALPVLSVAAAPEKLLAFVPIPAAVKDCSVLGAFQQTQGANPFVDRIDRRREITTSLRPFAPGQRVAHCVVVNGAEDSGKSWLVKRCERDLASAGMLVRHCELSGLKGLDFVEVLERILAGDATVPNSFVHQSLPEDHFGDFRGRAAEYRAGAQDEASIRRVCEAFRAGLQSAAAPQGLVIVLDQFRRAGGGGVAAAEFRVGLLAHFVIPIANGACPRVQLVLVTRNDELRDYGLDGGFRADRFDVDRFPAQAFAAHFLELCRFERNTHLEGLEQYWNGAWIRSAPWLPSKDLRELVAQALK